MHTNDRKMVGEWSPGDILGHPGTSWGILGPPGSSLGHPGASWAYWGLLVPPGDILEHLGAAGAFWGFLGLRGSRGLPGVSWPIDRRMTGE